MKKTERATMWTMVQMCTMVLVFVFFPGQAWRDWFLHDESYTYGELVVPMADRHYIVAKNDHDSAVSLGSSKATLVHAAATSMADGSVHGWSELPLEVPPRSWSVLHFHGEVSPSREIGSRLFTARPLRLLVPAEQTRWTVLLFVIMAAGSLVTYSGVRFLLEAGGFAEDSMEGEN